MDKAMYLYGKANNKGFIAAVFLLSCTALIILVLEPQKYLAINLSSVIGISMAIICSIIILRTVVDIGNASSINRRIRTAIVINFIIIATAGAILLIAM